MSGEIKVIRLGQENLYVKRDGMYLLIYESDACLSIRYKINIPLFYRIALYTKTRRTYKSLLTEFYDELTAEGICRFRSRESLKRAGTACGKSGGLTAFFLGIFCRYYDKHPRSINVVHFGCDTCRNKDISVCGNLSKCGDYYGCGKGVLIPLDAGFNVEEIPKLRVEIESENFEKP